MAKLFAAQLFRRVAIPTQKRFFAIAAERNEIAGRIKQLQPEVSNRQIAKTLGVNHDAELIAARQLFAIE
jgi:hypothetical protein